METEQSVGRQVDLLQFTSRLQIAASPRIPVASEVQTQITLSLGLE